MNKRNEVDAYTIAGAVDSDVVIHGFNAFCQTRAGPTVVVVDHASPTSEACQRFRPGRNTDYRYSICLNIPLS